MRFLLPATRHAFLNKYILASGVQEGISFRIGVSSTSTADERAKARELAREFPANVLDKNEFIVDYSKPGEVAKALEGCDGAVLSTSVANGHFHSVESNLIRAAEEVGLNRMLKVSPPSGFVREQAGVAFGRSHWELEQQLQSSKVQSCIVRPSTLMQSFLYGKWHDMVCGRTLSVSVKSGRAALVDATDVSDAIAKLLNGESDEKIYKLTGPQALRFQDMTQVLSDGIGDPVRYSYFPTWAVQPSMWIKGADPDAIAAELGTAKAYDSGADAEVTDTLEQLLERPLRSFDEFVSENKKAWPRAY